MWIELPPLWIALVNALGIPLVQLGISYAMLSVPGRFFDAQSRVAEPGFYQRWFRVRRWQGALPDAARWFGHEGKSGHELSQRETRSRLARECRRGEVAHWIQLWAVCGFTLVTPWPWALVIVLWAAISNVPCLVSLKSVRSRLLRMR